VNIQIEYRPATAEDFDWLLALRKQTMDPHLTASGSDPVESSHVEAAKKDYEWARIVMLHGQNVGMVKLIRTPPEWHLRHIQISPNHQRQGLGTAVMRQLLMEAEDASATVVLNVLRVNSAMHLYERLGFMEIDCTERSIRMRWRPHQGMRDFTASCCSGRKILPGA